MRSQAESLVSAPPRRAPRLGRPRALHHGSLDKEVRDWVELGLKEGRLEGGRSRPRRSTSASISRRSSGYFRSAWRKGIARLLQRAGRSGHAPGRASRITLVPTNTLELVEAAGGAARRRAPAGSRSAATHDKPRSTCWSSIWSPSRSAAASMAEAMYEEVKGAWAYRKLRFAASSNGRSTSSSRAARRPGRLSRIPPASLPTTRAAYRALNRADRAAPQAQRRHHRQRLVDAGEVPRAAVVMAWSRRASSLV